MDQCGELVLCEAIKKHVCFRLQPFFTWFFAHTNPALNKIVGKNHVFVCVVLPWYIQAGDDDVAVVFLISP